MHSTLPDNLKECFYKNKPTFSC